MLGALYQPLFITILKSSISLNACNERLRLWTSITLLVSYSKHSSLLQTERTFIPGYPIFGGNCLVFPSFPFFILLLALQKCLNDMDRATHPELKPNINMYAQHRKEPRPWNWTNLGFYVIWGRWVSSKPLTSLTWKHKDNNSKLLWDLIQSQQSAWQIELLIYSDLICFNMGSWTIQPTGSLVLCHSTCMFNQRQRVKKMPWISCFECNLFFITSYVAFGL